MRAHLPLRRNPWLQLALLVTALALLLGGYYWGHRHRRPALSGLEGAMLLRPPLPLPAFSAQTPAGLGVGREWLTGRWTLLLPDTDADPRAPGRALLTRVHNRLAADPGVQRALQLLMLTWERRLTPAPIYLPGLIEAHGEVEGLQALLATLHGTPGAPAALYLVDPQARAVAVFTAAQDPAIIARDLKRLMEAEALHW